MKRLISLLIRNIIFFLALIMATFAQAGVQLSTTRVIYPAQDREVTMNLNNRGDKAVLVQTWLDSGDPSVTPGTEKLPFIIVPPINRIDPHKGQTLRISYIGTPLPNDKESVFWINVLEIPSKLTSKDNGNKIKFAYRNRIKLFFRPETLPASLKSDVEKLNWSLIKKNGQLMLHADNSGAHYVTLSQIAINSMSNTFINNTGGMIPPYESVDFIIEGLTDHTSSAEIKAQWLDDYGSAHEIIYKL